MKLTKEAQELYDSLYVGNGTPKNLEQFQEEISSIDGFEYGLYDGGDIKPEKIIEGEDLEKLKEAIKIVGEFRDLWYSISIEF